MSADAAVPYGARPVSVDLTRHQALRVLQPVPPSERVEVFHAPARGRDCLDRLGVRHWPPGARIVVASLSGGAGRSTVAAAIADLLAGLPYAHIWASVLLVETNPRRSVRPHSLTDPAATDDCCGMARTYGRVPAVRPSGAHELLIPVGNPPATRHQTRTVLDACTRSHRVTVLDAPPGVPSDLPWVRDAASTTGVVLVVPPGHRSLDDAADALVWMNDTGALARHRVVVVVNTGLQPADRAARAAAVALSIRCRGMHLLGELTNDRRTRERLARVLLDVSAACQPDNTPRQRRDAS